MYHLILFVAIVNMLAVLFFAALYIKRVKIDSSKRTEEEAYKANRFANTYLPV